MADLSFLERECIESFFELRGGYVLDFTNQSFQDFVYDAVGKDIYDDKYLFNSGSKANRLRGFLKEESNYHVGILLEKLIEYATFKLEPINTWPEGKYNSYYQCQKSAALLKSDVIINDLHAIKPNNNDEDFKFLEKQIKESIEKNEPSAALDRLHTFYFKYIRQLCERHSIEYTKVEPMNSVYGKYVKFLKDNNHLDSAMAEMILKYSTNLIASFNDIRNNKSLAHDNQILNYDESILIVNNIASSIKFIDTIENKMKKLISEFQQQFGNDELPF